MPSAAPQKVELNAARLKIIWLQTMLAVEALYGTHDRTAAAQALLAALTLADDQLGDFVCDGFEQLATDEEALETLEEGDAHAVDLIRELVLADFRRRFNRKLSNAAGRVLPVRLVVSHVIAYLEALDRDISVAMSVKEPDPSFSDEGVQPRDLHESLEELRRALEAALAAEV